jgi:hypothetical protein
MTCNTEIIDNTSVYIWARSESNKNVTVYPNDSLRYTSNYVYIYHLLNFHHYNIMLFIIIMKNNIHKPHKREMRDVQ